MRFCPLSCLVGVALLGLAAGHGSMIMPPTRNSIDATLPAWSEGKHPMTGSIEPYSCNCSNGTDSSGNPAPCNNGQACFWFSQGCTIGCKACDAKGSRLPNYDHCPGSSIAPTNNRPEWRTANQHAKVGSPEDIYKFNPWRAPGMAPVADSCGMAGGSPVEVFNAGAFNATPFAKQGDLGTSVLKPRPTGTVWMRGGLAKARWEQTANHGGGYQYRLCPSSEPLTEECFSRHPLEFATPQKHRIVFFDTSLDRDIPATLVTDGGGKGWMKHPLPYITNNTCDYVVKPPNHCPYKCPKCGKPWYAADGACPVACQDQYPYLPNHTYGADPAIFPDPIPAGFKQTDFAIEDTLQVPSNIPEGDYVLQWRWDCEMTSQVWTNCADITIADESQHQAGVATSFITDSDNTVGDDS